METAWPEVKLRGWSCRSRAGKKRSSQLEKEVATLSEKIHHLDDMLKSQQRKVRHMIEQNLEMHDRIEHLIEAQQTSPGPKAAASDPSGGNLNFGNSLEFWEFSGISSPNPKNSRKIPFCPTEFHDFPPKIPSFSYRIP
ncbi:uncharacterized protein M8220_007449 isoform 5-T5 [Acridotheres tristis]